MPIYYGGRNGLVEDPRRLSRIRTKDTIILLEVMSKMSRAKLEDIEKKIQQLHAQKQAILNREKEMERKNRTRRLIEIGAIVEKGLNIKSKHMAIALVEYLTKYEDNFKKLSDYIEKNEPILKEKELQNNKKPLNS